MVPVTQSSGLVIRRTWFAGGIEKNVGERRIFHLFLNEFHFFSRVRKNNIAAKTGDEQKSVPVLPGLDFIDDMRGCDQHIF
jgi:hypothetical protein